MRHLPDIRPTRAANPSARDIATSLAEPDAASSGGDGASSGALRYHAPIREWHQGDRPREKLLARGPAALSDAELIALIFSTGTRTKAGPLSAVDLGRALLQEFDTLYRVGRRDLKEMQRVVGVGSAKAAQLAAAFEIGRRVEAQRGEEERVTVTSPEDIARVYGPRLRDLPREVFVVVFLSTAGVILGDSTISEGGLAASIVEPRLVFRQAMMENAASIICLHNHPSGNPEPSRADKQVTRQLVEAGKIVGIEVHDHVIIAGMGFTSLAQRGLM